ncbi:hypothetical protein [Salinigranum salinum]|uniref:hypothetical protein n=1 Tax=Salinigranum salinum TaxID=1364937 RepID=UPI0012609773|nr:hypothetical protein [Salinigranum salinum]
MSDYLVEVKRSARRSNAAVGSVVCQRGVRHRFDGRDEAESWADDLADDPGEGNVWIRAANPDDGSNVDAYLVGWLHRVTARTPDESPGEQAWLADFGWTGTTTHESRRGTEPRYGGERITDWLASE